MEVRRNPEAPDTPLQLLAGATWGPGDPRSRAFGGGIPKTVVVRPDGETNVDGVTYQKYTPGVEVPNWDGGFEELGKSGDWRENVKRASEDASTAFRWLSVAFNLAGFSVSSVAQNDFRKDIRAARKKLDASNEALMRANREAEAVANQLVSLGGELDSLRGELGDILGELADLRREVQSATALLEPLLANLAQADQLVRLALEQQKFAENRANFPPGIQGAQQQKIARQRANQAVADAKKAYDSANRDASIQAGRVADAVGDHNAKQAQGVPVAETINLRLAARAQLETRLYELLRNFDGPLRSRSESIMDMQRAQEVYRSKLATGFALTQTATGLSGVEDALAHIAAGRYFEAGGSVFSGAYGASAPYFGSDAILPYTALIRKGIEIGARTLERGGDIRDFAFDFGEATVGLRTAGNMITTLIRADEMMAEPGNEYAASNLIVDSAGLGVDVLGKIASTGSVFFTGGIPVGPLVQPATVVAREGLTGTLQAGVTFGYLLDEGRGFSAPSGTGQISGASAVLFSPFSILLGIGNAFSGGPSARENIRALAETGVSRIPPLRLSKNAVTLRPTIPEAPAGGVVTSGGVVSSPENVDEWMPVTGEPTPPEP